MFFAEFLVKFDEGELVQTARLRVAARLELHPTAPHDGHTGGRNVRPSRGVDPTSGLVAIERLDRLVVYFERPPPVPQRPQPRRVVL